MTVVACLRQTTLGQWVLVMYMLWLWILTILRDSTPAAGVFFENAQIVSGLVAVFFFAIKIRGLGLWPYSRTACPVS